MQVQQPLKDQLWHLLRSIWLALMFWSCECPITTLSSDVCHGFYIIVQQCLLSHRCSDLFFMLINEVILMAASMISTSENEITIRPRCVLACPSKTQHCTCPCWDHCMPSSCSVLHSRAVPNQSDRGLILPIEHC